MTKDNYIERLKKLLSEHRTQYGKLLRNPENKDLLDFINSYESEKLKNNSMQTKIHWLFNDIHDYPKCHNPNCPHGGLVKGDVRGIFKGYGTDYPTCCSSCAKHTPQYLKNFGDSMERKYGCRHPMHCQEIKDRVRETTERIWGGIGWAYSEIREKYEDKCMELYGVKNGGGSEQALKKIIETKMKRYNHPYFVFPSCKQGMVSKGEKEVLEYVKSIYHGTIIENDRTQMEPDSENGWVDNHELDIWLPDVKVAIEYNGTYWHSLPTRQESDKFKQIQCESKGIRLITIHEEDWSNNRVQCEDLICKALSKL